MKEKNIKLIMELIFIFILPLLFLCFSSSITVNNNFTYDSNGNYEISSNLKKLSFDNSFIKYENGFKNIINNFNLWDEEWEVGRLNDTTGIKENGYNNTIRSKNLINCLPNTSYKNYCKNSSDLVMYIFFYDINENFISKENKYCNSDTTPFVTPSNCYYLMFYLQASYGTTYNKDICINNSINWANGNYVPYGKPLILYTETDVSGQNIINYSIWGKIKNLLIDNLSINDSIVLDIIICYSMLWFIMFVIWHFFYLFFDGLVHLFVDWKKRSE